MAHRRTGSRLVIRCGGKSPASSRDLGADAKPERKNSASSTQVVQMVRPPLRHVHSLRPMRAAVVRGTDGVSVLMRQSALDRVRRPFTGLIQQNARHCTESMRRHLVATKAEAAEGRVDGVLRHGASPRPDRGKDIAAVTGQSFGVPEQLCRLPRERHQVLDPSLHALCRDAPDTGFQIKFCPFSPTQFARANEEQSRQLQGCPCQNSPLVSIDCPQQLACLLRVKDCRKVLWPSARQRTTKVARWV